LFVYGPYDLRILRPNLERDFPGIRLIVLPLDAGMLEQQLHGRPMELTQEERAGYAREAVSLLVRIAADRDGPMTGDLIAVEPDLAMALGSPETEAGAAAVLSELPNPNAQRSLAALVLDPSRPPAPRNRAAAMLDHSIQRFGPLVTAVQESRLARAVDEEPEPSVQASLAMVLKALKRAPAAAVAAPRPPAPPSPAAAPPPPRTPRPVPPPPSAVAPGADR
jgi:hypothetical protein